MYIKKILLMAIIPLTLAGLSFPSCTLDSDSAARADEPVSVEDQEAMEELAEIDMENSKFSPGEVEISAGTRVTWTNSDPYSHTVTSGTRGDPAGIFDSGTISGGGTYSYTFQEAGTYEYFCEFHEGMKGVIIVTE